MLDLFLEYSRMNSSKEEMDSESNRENAPYVSTGHDSISLQTITSTNVDRTTIDHVAAPDHSTITSCSHDEVLAKNLSDPDNEITKQIGRSEDDERTISTEDDSYSQEENIDQRDPPNQTRASKHHHDFLPSAPHNHGTSTSLCSSTEVSSLSHDITLGDISKSFNKQHQQEPRFVAVNHPWDDHVVDPYKTSPLSHTDGGAKTQSTRVLPRAEHLYNLSKAKQEEGKKRRDAIAIASNRRRQLPNPEDFGILPISKLNDMYYKGTQTIYKKNLWIFEEQKKRAKDEFAQNDKRGLRLLSSRYVDMYKRSLKHIHAKRERIYLAKKAKQQEVQQARDGFERICISRALHVHTRGAQYLQAKEEKLTKLREEDNASQKHKTAAILSSGDNTTTTMCTMRKTRERLRAKTVRQVVEDYRNGKEIWLRPYEALFLAEHLTGESDDGSTPANISSATCEFLELTNLSSVPIQGKEEKSRGIAMTANESTSGMLDGCAWCHSDVPFCHENEENSTYPTSRTDHVPTLTVGGWDCWGDNSM